MSDTDAKLKEGLREQAVKDLEAWYEERNIAIAKQKDKNRLSEADAPETRSVPVTETAGSCSMSWLADSFLADLEDIDEDSSMKMEVSENALPATILTDSNFSTFLSTSLSPSSNELHYLRVIDECSKWTPLIDSEIRTLYTTLSNICVNFFPELEQLILDPLEYIRVVHCIMEHRSPSPISEETFAGLGLPHNLIVAISVTAATSNSTLPPQVPSYIKERAEALHAARTQMLNFMSAGSPQFFPNLSALLGPALTARLVAAAGGLTSLSSMPSQNIESVGRTLTATGTGQTAKKSLIEQCDLVLNASPDLRKRALRLVLGKASLAARVDRHGGAATVGARSREEILDALSPAPPPARAIKPLPIPVEKPKNKRGGRRARKAKELYGISDVRKRENRLGFGPNATSDYGERDKGMVNVELGHGRIRKKP